MEDVPAAADDAGSSEKSRTQNRVTQNRVTQNRITQKKRMRKTGRECGQPLQSLEAVQEERVGWSGHVQFGKAEDLHNEYTAFVCILR